jgi:four helix bundle protein
VTIQRFEDIKAWQRGRELARVIYQITGKEPLACDYGLRDQLRRAAVSVVSNIAEGFERGGTGEFRQFLSQAKGSAGEIKAQLYIARDVGLLAEEDFATVYALADETGRMIGGLMRYLARSEIRGPKYHNV